LHAAAWQGHDSIVSALLTAGANRNARDQDGNTPLHKAAWRGNAEAAKVLLANGADARAKDVDGYTALDKARSAKRESVVALLEAAAKR
jgi:ankyrin repeat protein